MAGESYPRRRAPWFVSPTLPQPKQAGKAVIGWGNEKFTFPRYMCPHYKHTQYVNSPDVYIKISFADRRLTTGVSNIHSPLAIAPSHLMHELGGWSLYETITITQTVGQRQRQSGLSGSRGSSDEYTCVMVMECRGGEGRIIHCMKWTWPRPFHALQQVGWEGRGRERLIQYEDMNHATVGLSSSYRYVSSPMKQVGGRYESNIDLRKESVLLA